MPSRETGGSLGVGQVSTASARDSARSFRSDQASGSSRSTAHSKVPCAAGASVPGWKLVAGPSARVITDPAEAQRRLLAGGFTEDEITAPRALLGITALTKLTKPKVFDDLLGDIVTKREGAPTLVPIDDPRPQWSGTTTPEDDFA